jgi:spoIIIJ-associated protein
MNYSEFGDNAKTYLEKILAILDIDATVVTEEVDETTACYRIECKAEEARILIGRNGQTLEALQFVVRQMCKSNAADQGPFVIDILDYRARRKRSLEDQAKRAAVAVLNGESDRFALLPMKPYERRIVHQYLHEDFPDLASESEGEGLDRHIVISFRGLPDGRKRERVGNESEEEEFFEQTETEELPEEEIGKSEEVEHLETEDGALQ